MALKEFSNISVDDTKREYFDILKQNGMAPKTEIISVVSAAGRYTAAPVYANICAPHYNVCAMDGIALDASLTAGASETVPVKLTSGQYRKVDTGDPLPEGCDAVVMTEEAVNTGGGTIVLYSETAPWRHIRQIGEDICAGDMLLPSYTQITPSALGAMIAGGVTEVSVIKRPVVGIIHTGGGLISPETDSKPGDFLEFNSSVFAAMLTLWGSVPSIRPVAVDNPAQITAAAETALAECDAVLLNTGSAAGGEDYAAEAIAKIGTVFRRGLAIKPGRPAILAFRGEKPILGVPGYPVAGIIVIEELLRPIVEYLCGMPDISHEYASAVLSKAALSTAKFKEYVRIRLGYVDGRLIASPLNRGSGIVTSFMKADGILEIPQGSEGFESGSCVNVRLLRPSSELKNTLVAIGSHDPLLDVLSDLLRVNYRGFSMSSSHAGSMGGILSVRRREAHLAGTHLLDESTGEYNLSFIKKHFPNGGVRLVECVRRSQGLMLQKGNPMDIRDIRCLLRAGLRYVNRQKGSGTRVLLDYLCKKNDVDTSQIYGYSREEYTHTAVAALIAADSADAGLGIYSAALMYGLDYVELYEEQYDLLIPDYAWELPMIHSLLEILKSDTFRQRLDKMGGYSLNNPGSVRERF